MLTKYVKDLIVFRSGRIVTYLTRPEPDRVHHRWKRGGGTLTWLSREDRSSVGFLRIRDLWFLPSLLPLCSSPWRSRFHQGRGRCRLGCRRTASRRCWRKGTSTSRGSTRPSSGTSTPESSFPTSPAPPSVPTVGFPHRYRCAHSSLLFPSGGLRLHCLSVVVILIV